VVVRRVEVMVVDGVGGVLWWWWPFVIVIVVVVPFPYT
jgi:hypothetical protein